MAGRQQRRDPRGRHRQHGDDAKLAFSGDPAGPRTNRERPTGCGGLTRKHAANRPEPPEMTAETTGQLDLTGGPAPRVVILLSTFNGAAFLPQQLQSFMAQMHTNWILLWRDDGSSDDTVAIVEAFAAGRPGCMRVQEPTGRWGATASFLLLLRAAREIVQSTDLVAFSDQDDVWLPRKLARGVASLSETEPECPALYCARQILVDGGLHRIGESPKVLRTPAFPASLAQNVASGCTTMLNFTAVALVAASLPPRVAYHDWWCYILVTAAGGTCLCDDAEVILYRQHSRNAVGAPASTFRRAYAALWRGPTEFMTLLRAHLSALAEHPSLISQHARRDIVRLQGALRGGPVRRWATLWSLGLQRQSVAETLIFYLWFIIG